MEIYLMRHGETYLNIYEKMQGWSDAPLTKKGERELHLVAEKMKEMKFNAIYSSDLGRAIQSAEIIKSHNSSLQNLPILKMDNFRETFFGEIEGDYISDTWQKVAEKLGYLNIEEAFNDGIGYLELTNGIAIIDPANQAETFLEVADRFFQGLKKIEYKENDAILIVTHGNALRSVVYTIDPTIDLMNTHLHNGCLTKIIYDGENYFVDFFGKSLIKSE